VSRGNITPPLSSTTRARGAIDSPGSHLCPTIFAQDLFAGALPLPGALRVAGRRRRVRLGLIGCGGRGKHLVHMAQLAGGAEFVAIADAWDQRMDEAEKASERPSSVTRTIAPCSTAGSRRP